jgi:hypothetical protein
VIFCIYNPSQDDIKKKITLKQIDIDEPECLMERYSSLVSAAAKNEINKVAHASLKINDL